MTELPQQIDFLSMDDVHRLHAEMLARYRGQEGVRSPGGLESAVTMARQTFGGFYVHEDLAAMAAAYLYHIAESQAYVDGNKRTAVAAAIMFLALNGVRLEADEMDLYELTLSIAKREGLLRATKQDIADFIRRHSQPY